jgi:hypothetical protein
MSRRLRPAAGSKREAGKAMREEITTEGGQNKPYTLCVQSFSILKKEIF